MGTEDVYGQHGPIARSRRVCVDIQVPVHDLRFGQKARTPGASLNDLLRRVP